MLDFSQHHPYPFGKRMDDLLGRKTGHPPSQPPSICSSRTELREYGKQRQPKEVAFGRSTVKFHDAIVERLKRLQSSVGKRPTNQISNIYGDPIVE